MKKDIPTEVLWVHLLPPMVGSDTYNEAERIIAKYPKYFPWETKYNSIPSEVHLAYRREKYPGFDKPIVCSGEGLLSKIDNEVFMYKEYTNEEIIKWFEDLRKIDESEKIKKQKDKELWDKYYGKYNLEYRE